MKTDTKKQVYFQPTFGNRPESIVGRDTEINDFIMGLRDLPGSRDRCTLFLGQRGMGKTALLLELEERACETGYVVARVTAHDKMTDAIIEQIQLKGASFFKDDKKRLTGVSAGALGFSIGLTFSESTERQFGFRAKMSLLCDKLAEKGKGILILIDEVHSSSAMREVAASYQELVGDGKNIAIGMAGLPHAISSILNDQVLTFLNRANKVELGIISEEAIKAYFDSAFSALGIGYTEKAIRSAAKKTKGMPYLMQLVGYYLVMYTKETKSIDEKVLKKAEDSALRDMESNVFKPIISPLSDNDRLFISKMAEIGDPVPVAKLQKALGDKGTSLQTYRKRLVEAGIIESPRRGELVFAVPYLSEYLRENAEWMQ